MGPVTGTIEARLPRPSLPQWKGANAIVPQPRAMETHSGIRGDLFHFQHGQGTVNDWEAGKAVVRWEAKAREAKKKAK